MGLRVALPSAGSLWLIAQFPAPLKDMRHPGIKDSPPLSGSGKGGGFKGYVAGCGFVVADRAHAAEPHIDTAPRP